MKEAELIFLGMVFALIIVAGLVFFGQAMIEIGMKLKEYEKKQKEVKK